MESWKMKDKQWKFHCKWQELAFWSKTKTLLTVAVFHFSDLTGHQLNPQTYNKQIKMIVSIERSWVSLPVCLMINWMNTLLTSLNIRPAEACKRARFRLILLLPIRSLLTTCDLMSLSLFYLLKTWAAASVTRWMHRSTDCVRDG